MDSQEPKASDSPSSASTPVSDTSYVASQVIVTKKSHKALYVTMIVIVLLFAVAAVGAYFYKMNVIDKPVAVKTTPVETAKEKEMTDEEKMTAALTDATDRELDQQKQNEESNQTIQNSTSAATSVGGVINEDDLQ